MIFVYKPSRYRDQRRGNFCRVFFFARLAVRKTRLGYRLANVASTQNFIVSAFKNFLMELDQVRKQVRSLTSTTF